MGIRIHNVLGYGLVDVKNHDGEIIDNRFNPDSVIFASYDDDRYSYDAYKQHIETIFNEKKSDGDLAIDLYMTMSALQNGKLEIEFGRTITYDGEFGLADVICFTPLSHINEWYQYDNTVDYYLHSLLRDKGFIESTTCNDSMSWCQTMNFPFYPYSGYIDKTTGEAPSGINGLIDHYRSLEAFKDTINDQTRNKKLEDTLTDILGKLGCEKHWNEKYTPAIPHELVELLRFGKVFRDDSTIWQLQPMIYSYWS